MVPKRWLGISLAFIAGVCITAIALKPELRRLLQTDSAYAEAALYDPADWRRLKPSKLNISVFTFGDRNHNGVYDTLDKPLNRIAVRLTRPDGSTRIERSNINGFANFSMQRDGEGADITSINAAYEFEVLPPPGWTITTQNPIQESSFKSVSGSISGLGANSPPEVVGLVPPPTVSHVRGGPDRDVSAAVDVDYAPIVLGSPVTALAERSSPRPMLTVGFDDLERSAIEKIASGYAGLNWDYLLAVDNQFYKGPGYVNGLMSGAMVAYNSSGHPVTISALKPGETFDFLGGYFSVAWHNAEGETLRIKAWRGDTLVAEDSLNLSHLTPTYFQADYQDITRLQFETEHYWQFVVDDLSFGLP
ncbi:MAG: hypothetical protein NWP69_09730 [Congregibacter sp.]|nr:hypothetical protein [Congregibacter sp.]MDP5069851.1 hypothetical protein [Congregibacter sp.]